jgi:hypothetical protein
MNPSCNDSAALLQTSGSLAGSDAGGPDGGSCCQNESPWLPIHATKEVSSFAVMQQQLQRAHSLHGPRLLMSQQTETAITHN